MAELADVAEPKISVWGVSYKGNVDDARETPAAIVLQILEANGARASVVDFHVKRWKYPLDDLETSVTDADCILLLTDHREFAFLDPETIGKKMRSRTLLDTHHALPRDRWANAGFRIVAL